MDDVRPHIAARRVYVVPLRIGGGTRLKIFEAMAMAKAVVSTTVGAEGLPVTDGADIVLADEPARFAHAVVALIRDAERARSGSSAAARALVVERYDWSAVARISRTRWRASPTTGADESRRFQTAAPENVTVPQSRSI